MEAAAVYGRGSKPFEQVALTFIDNFHSVLCLDMAIKQIDEPFITQRNNREEWTL
jgi:hypothetical protein